MKFQMFVVFILFFRIDSSFPTSTTDFAEKLIPEADISVPVVDEAITLAKQLTNLSDYYATRTRFMQAEKNLMSGALIKLNELESKVDEIFMKHKKIELNFSQNSAGLHFFRAKPLIQRSKIYAILRKMPKGAILHVHSKASVSSDWVVRKLSYMPGLLRCTNKYGVSILSFRKSESHGCTTSYISVDVERRRSFNATIYDFYLEKLINLYTPNPEVEYASVDKIWKKFENIFTTISDAVMYIEAYRLFHWQMLEEMYNDNIMYAEVRSSVHELYDLNGRRYEKERTIKELIDVVNRFRKVHPKFLGLKFIYTQHRTIDSNMLSQQIEEVKKLQSKFPNFIVGFDLVGQEDKGKPLLNFIGLLQKSYHPTYFFHAGETSEFGATTDYNLFDAILLNTKRIGHGYMLMKHPLLRRIVKQRKIAIEVCPISNQVLGLTKDLRNHPGGIFLAEDIPMVISNDDPGLWGAEGLSYDFYYAIMSLASQESGLRQLKTLALNSLKYSAMTENELKRALLQFEQDWSIFLKEVLKL